MFALFQKNSKHFKKTDLMAVFDENEEDSKEDREWRNQCQKYEQREKSQRKTLRRQIQNLLKRSQKQRPLFRRIELIMMGGLVCLLAVGILIAWVYPRTEMGVGTLDISTAEQSQYTCDTLENILNAYGFPAKKGADDRTVEVGPPPNFDTPSSPANTIYLDEFVRYLPSLSEVDKVDVNEDVIVYDQPNQKICVYRPASQAIDTEILRQLSLKFQPDKVPAGSFYCKSIKTADDAIDFIKHVNKDWYAETAVTVYSDVTAGIYPVVDQSSFYIGQPPDFTKASEASISAETDFLNKAEGIRNLDYHKEAKTICVPGNWKTGDQEGGSVFSRQAVIELLTKANQSSSAAATADADSPSLWDQITGFFDPIEIAKKIWNFIWDQIKSVFVDLLWKPFTNWISSMLFPYITPANMTYNLGIVVAGRDWTWSLVGGLGSVALVIGGYQLVSRRYLGEPTAEAMDTLVQVCLGLLAAAFSHILLNKLIDIESDLTRGITASMFVDTAYNQPLNGGDESWVQRIFTNAINLTVGEGGVGAIVALILNIVMGVLLILQMLVRIITLDLTLMLAPLWTFCLFFRPLRKIGVVGMKVFGVTLFVQVPQVMALDMGSILIANSTQFGVVPNNEMSPVISFALGVMSYYTTFKIPGMMYVLFQAGGGFSPMNLVNGQIMNTATNSWNNVKSTAESRNAVRGAISGARGARPAMQRARQMGFGWRGASRLLGRAAMRGARKATKS
jgi:hypothetical protein